MESIGQHRPVPLGFGSVDLQLGDHLRDPEAPTTWFSTVGTQFVWAYVSSPYLIYNGTCSVLFVGGTACFFNDYLIVLQDGIHDKCA